MDKIIQQNAATADHSASAASEMTSQAEQLKRYVQQLVMLITGQKAPPPSPKSEEKQRLPIPNEIKPDQVIRFDEDQDYTDF